MIDNTIQRLQLNTKDLVTAAFIMQKLSNDFKSACIKESCQTKTRLKGEMNQQLWKLPLRTWYWLKLIELFVDKTLEKAWGFLSPCWLCCFTSSRLHGGDFLSTFPICDVKVSASLLRQDPTCKTSTGPKQKGRTAAKLSFTPDESKHPPRSLWG